MAVSKFNFTKDWKNPGDFPPVVDSETQARENIQLLHDETKNFINDTLIPVINQNSDKTIPDDTKPMAKYALGVENGEFYIEEVGK